MKYKMDRSGLGKFMRSNPALQRRLHQVAREQRGRMSARAPRSKPGSGGRTPGTLASSGRVEDLGIKPVYKGEPRMTVAVVFYAPYAAAVQKRTGFMWPPPGSQFSKLPSDFSEG